MWWRSTVWRYRASAVDLREADCKDTEVPLETAVDGEAASSWVHGGNVLDILDILEGLLLTIIPVIVVQMLQNLKVY